MTFRASEEETLSQALIEVSARLCETIDTLRFGAPVTHVYNPLMYAWETHVDFLRRFGDGDGRVVLLGMCLVYLWRINI